ncbi:MAG: hypothetical protein RIS87_1482, partial [Pseudomonadota bacterium]
HYYGHYYIVGATPRRETMVQSRRDVAPTTIHYGHHLDEQLHSAS